MWQFRRFGQMYAYTPARRFDVPPDAHGRALQLGQVSASHCFAGCRWQRLYNDVLDASRLCRFCGSIKDSLLVTGHWRRPVDVLLATNVIHFSERFSHSKYVLDLVAQLKTVHRHVDEQHNRVCGDADRERMKFGPGEWLSESDYVLEQRPLHVGASARYQPKSFDEFVR